MSAVSRMLGRWRGGGCGCKTPGPDCAGHDRDTRRRKRQELRAVDREIREALADRQASAYGYDSPRRRPEPAVREEMRRIRRRRVVHWAATRSRAAFWLYAFIFISLTAVAVFAVAYDHTPKRLDFPTPPQPAAVSSR